MKEWKSEKNNERKSGKSRKKGKKIIAVICAAVLLTVSAAGITIKLKSGKKNTEATTRMTAQAELGDVSTSVTSSGTLEGKEEYTISAPSGIQIKEVLVSEGDEVKKGTKLASVYPASAARVLLDVKESIESVEDSLDELDEDEISDTSSDDYLKKLAYDQEISDLEDLEDWLQEVLESGYIKAESSGILGTINVSDDSGTSSSSGNSSGITDTGSTSAAAISAVRTAYTTGNTGNTGMTARVRLLSSAASEADRSDLSEMTTSSAPASQESTTEDDTDSSTEKSDGDSADSSTSSEESGTDSTDATDTSEEKDTDGSSQSSESSEATTSTQSGGNNSSTGKDGSSAGQKKNTGDTSTGTTPSGTRNGFGKQGISGGNSAVTAGSLTAGSADASTESETIADIEMEKLFILNSVSQMLVNVSIDEADIGSIETGQTAEVTLTAFEGETFEGVISGISNASSSSGNSVKYQVEITIDKADGMLSGMSASAVIYIEKAENVLLIPSAAIQEKEGKAYVYTQKDDDGTLSGETEVTTGLSDGSQVQITEGLSEGDTVYYELFSSNDSGSDSNRKDSDTMRDFNGGGFGNGNGRPGGMPGNPPSGGPFGGN